MPTRINLNLLEVANPCPADWDAMRGDDAKRFCKHCSLHVYNLSAMSADRAEQFMAERGDGHVCIRMYKRADGTVVTDDCRGGWRKSLKRATSLAATVAAAVLAVVGSKSAWAGGDKPVMGDAVEPTSRPTSPPVMGTPVALPTTTTSMGGAAPPPAAVMGEPLPTTVPVMGKPVMPPTTAPAWPAGALGRAYIRPPTTEPIVPK